MSGVRVDQIAVLIRYGENGNNIYWLTTANDENSNNTTNNNKRRKQQQLHQQQHTPPTTTASNNNNDYNSKHQQHQQHLLQVHKQQYTTPTPAANNNDYDSKQHQRQQKTPPKANSNTTSHTNAVTRLTAEKSTVFSLCRTTKVVASVSEQKNWSWEGRNPPPLSPPTPPPAPSTPFQAPILPRSITLKILHTTKQRAINRATYHTRTDHPLISI